MAITRDSIGVAKWQLGTPVIILETHVGGFGRFMAELGASEPTVLVSDASLKNESRLARLVAGHVSADRIMAVPRKEWNATTGHTMALRAGSHPALSLADSLIDSGPSRAAIATLTASHPVCVPVSSSSA